MYKKLAVVCSFHNGSFTLADPDSDPYSDSDSCTIQILRERDLDPDLNECEKFWIILCSHRVWSPNPSPDPAMWMSHNNQILLNIDVNDRIFYRPRTKQGNVFAHPVCLFTGGLHRGGSASRGAGLHPGGVCIPWVEGLHPEGSLHPGCRSPPSHRILRDTVNEWAVRIPLECILVFLIRKSLTSYYLCSW